MKENIQRVEETSKALEAMGIKPAHFEEIFDLLQQHKEAKYDAEKAREKQFEEDAFDLGAKIKAANKVTEISQFLRQFAEHIARHTLESKHTQVDDIVDHIPQIHQVEDPIGLDERLSR